MRRTIETAPRDGNVIILEDDAKGTYDVAHWSPEAGEWVGESGEPTKITPSHWYPMQARIFLPLEHYGSRKPSQVGPSPVAPARRYATSSVAAALVAEPGCEEDRFIGASPPRRSRSGQRAGEGAGGCTSRAGHGGVRTGSTTIPGAG